MEPENRIVRPKEAMHITGMSRAHLYREADKPGFPAKYRLTAKCVGWMHADLIAWLESRREGEVQA
ncbi:helix-turn-helix transcriptional regulator [Alcanivorax jadensis]|uniref:helix-turn-helix transcriptional regulator n=1 Tax=Alcanivorax jadensis TaxID=64988 RepID=UPI00356B27C6